MVFKEIIENTENDWPKLIPKDGQLKNFKFSWVIELINYFDFKMLI